SGCGARMPRDLHPRAAGVQPDAPHQASDTMPIGQFYGWSIRKQSCERSGSDPDEMDLDQWALAETLIDYPAQKASDRITHAFVVTARPGLHFLDRTLDRIAQKGCGRGRCCGLHQSNQADLRGCRETAPTVDNHGGDGAP